MYAVLGSSANRNEGSWNDSQAQEPGRQGGIRGFPRVAIVIGLFAAVFARPAHSAGTTVIIGTKNFPEEFILGQLYKQALEAKGCSVSYKENIDSTELIHTSLTSGKINFYPEYTGVIVQVVHHRALSPKTARATYLLAKKLEAASGLTVLKPTLTKVTFVPLAGISAYAALDAGTVLAADVFSTDPPLGNGSKYTVLADPKHVTGFQNVVPIVKMSVVTALGSKFTVTVNAVSAKLTQNAIVAMNKAVIVDKQSAAKVASAFLKANGLK